MLFELKCWLNIAMKRYPRIRLVVLRCAMAAGVRPIASEVLSREQSLMNSSGFVHLSGKPRLLMRVRPSVRRNLKLVEEVLSRDKECE